ncbi:MAG: hypothetical protein HYW01_05665 [Deltaproteobacteria bacterium]|nr:hypothetical protein [Deltaproteobacteria bacterium]
MISKDGVLVSIIWIIFTLLFAIATVAILNPSPSPVALRSLVGPKLVFFSLIIAIAALEYRLSRTESKEQISSLSRTFVTIITFGLLFSLLFSVSIDLAHSYSLNINSQAYNVSVVFFISSIYFILTLFAMFFYTALIE